MGRISDEPVCWVWELSNYHGFFSHILWTSHTYLSPLVEIVLALYLIIVVEWGYTWVVVNTHRKVLARMKREVDEDQYRAPL